MPCSSQSRWRCPAALDSTVADVNVDIRGAVLLPSLAETTVLIGAVTGGDLLIDAALEATEASALEYLTVAACVRPESQ